MQCHCDGTEGGGTNFAVGVEVKIPCPILKWNVQWMSKGHELEEGSDDSSSGGLNGRGGAAVTRIA